MEDLKIEVAEVDVGLPTGDILHCSMCRDTFVGYSSKSQGAPNLDGPIKVSDFMRPHLKHLDREEFFVLLMDAKMGLRRVLRITTGSLSAALVHPRDVFKLAVQEPAHAVILIHNHPSGDPEPSDEDKSLTARLVAAGDILGIRVTDHVIVAGDTWFSFSEAGILR